MIRHLAVGSMACLLGMLVGCAHEQPRWVARGSHVASGVHYGVGKSPASSQPLGRAVAANRARAEIVTRLSRGSRVSTALLRGVEIREIWTAPDGTIYALAVYRKLPKTWAAARM